MHKLSSGEGIIKHLFRVTEDPIPDDVNNLKQKYGQTSYLFATNNTAPFSTQIGTFTVDALAL